VIFDAEGCSSYDSRAISFFLKDEGRARWYQGSRKFMLSSYVSQQSPRAWTLPRHVSRVLHDSAKWKRTQRSRHAAKTGRGRIRYVLIKREYMFTSCSRTAIASDCSSGESESIFRDARGTDRSVNACTLGWTNTWSHLSKEWGRTRRSCSLMITQSFKVFYNY